MKALILAFLLSVMSGVCAEARSMSDYGSVDLGEEYKAALSAAEENSETLITNAEENIIANYGFAHEARIVKLFSYLSNNKWYVTRSLLFGMENSEAAKQTFIEASIEKDLQQLKENAAKAVNYTAYMIPGGLFVTGAADEATGDYLTNAYYDTKKAEYEDTRRKHLETVVDKIFDIPFMDATGDDTIYARVRNIGYILLVTFVIIRLAFILCKNIITDDQVGGRHATSLEMREALVYFIVIALLITFMRPMIQCVLLFSDLCRDILLGLNLENGMNDLTTTYSTLSLLKASAIGMNMDTGYLIWFRAAATPLKWLITWACYAIVAGIIFVIVTLADIMIGILAILSPLTLSISILPLNESWRQNYFHSLFKYSLYIPIAGLFSLLMVYFHTVMPNLGFMPYVILSYSFYWTASTIPTMAEQLSGNAIAASMSSKTGNIIAKTPSAAMRFSTKRNGS